MKEISRSLGAESWAIVEATLRQFSLPQSEEWNGTLESYVLRMIADADDATLVDLAAHVGHQFESAEVPLRVDPPFWQKAMLRVFMTHLSSHRDYAAELQAELLEFGISSFVAHNDIEPTTEWQTQIETALATCDSLVALMHSKFRMSNWTDQEIGFAMGRGVPVFSVRLGETPYGFIGKFQAFNGHDKTTAELARELFDTYRKSKQTKHRMSEGLVELFEESNNFADAKLRVGYLEELDTWTPSFSNRIRTAVENNSQIFGSWGVPERVKALLEKWPMKVVNGRKR